MILEDLEWELQLKESEVALAYTAVQKFKTQGSEIDIAEAEMKLKELLEEEAALAYVVLEKTMDGTSGS